MKSPFLKLLGLFLLVAVIAIGVKIGVTNPFFSDTETSTNNALSVADSFDPNPGDVVINELMWMGSQGNAADEWIELRNMTGSTIDLSGWKVVNLATGPGGTITIPSGKSIPPNGFFVIANDDNDPQSTSAMIIIPNYFNSGVSLLDPGEQLTLKDSSDNVIDTADNDGGGWFAGQNGAGPGVPEKSMERNSTPGDGTVSTNWHTASIQVNIDVGNREIASPGAANSP